MYLWCILLLFGSSFGHPIDPQDVEPKNAAGVIFLGLAFLLVAVVTVVFCACCRDRRDGFKEFTNPGSLGNVGFTNALATEVAIFPPPGSVRQTPPYPINSDLQPSKPAAFSSSVPDVSDWFIDTADFPRQQLFYQKEIGKGWFGKVVEGEARGSKVIVRILREDATPEEKAFFLHEAKPYRDLNHKNVCRLFGRCLELDPYLLLFELHNNKDLKNFLLLNGSSRRALHEKGISLKLMTDIGEGLKFMNDNGFIHTDLAARNCLVTSDLTVKIGDYGTSIDLYKNEYYIVGDVAVPIRWCAPETLQCTSTTIETKQVTAAANVWSLAVVLWEVAEFGRLPYEELSDDQVISQVFGAEKIRLPQPECPYGQYLYHIMQICWRSDNRATIDQVLSMLRYLKSNPFQESDFEARWKKLKPNTVPVVDNHTPIHSPRHTELAQRPRLVPKSEFDSGVDLEIKPTDENPDSAKTSSPMTISPQLSVTSEEIFQSSQKKSPSLTNLQGSFEDVSQFDSWLQGVETKTEEDRRFARNISEAIKNLDETLALEKTSSSSADSSVEGSKKPLIDFKLGPIDRKSESSSDTEEETWRCRIERGEFTEKVKEKSKSVTDLMVLTHIDSEESENDSLPSLTRQYSLKRGPKGTTYTSIGFGSEGNIRNAVISEELQEKLKSLTIWKTDDLLPSLTKKQTEPFLGKAAPAKLTTNPESPTSSQQQSDINFLAEAASEKPLTKTETHLVNSHSVLDSLPIDSPEAAYPSIIESSQDNSVPKIIITESETPCQEDEEDVISQPVVPSKPWKFVFGGSANDEKPSVILGSCEEHTLDFFQGLKTTFSPVEVDSEDESSSSAQPESATNDSSPTSSGTYFLINTSSDTCPSRKETEINCEVPSTDGVNDSGCVSQGRVDDIKQEIGTDDSFSELNSSSSHDSPISNSKPLESSLSKKVLHMSQRARVKCDSKTGENDETQPNTSFDSIPSVDSGHSSEQDKQMNDLKNRLEDVMKFGDDYQLKCAEDEYEGKLLTPDDERSSDSGFRDKGSLSESVEDTCDDKYNLEDIDAELEDYTVMKNVDSDVKYYGEMGDGEPWFLHRPEKNGWFPVSTEDEEKHSVTLDAEFVAAIRNELQEKLPGSSLPPKATEEEFASPEVDAAEVQFSYPSQLSPILEEQESNHSSLVDELSPVLILPPPDMDAIHSGEAKLDSLNDDVLVIDTETNEVTLIESPRLHGKPTSKDDDSTGINSETYILSPNHAMTPDISQASETLSSPGENHSGLFMSPSSVRSDLFDSGPPSLPFDLGQSLDEVEDISDKCDLGNGSLDHKRAEEEVDLLLEKKFENIVEVPEVVEPRDIGTDEWLRELLTSNTPSPSLNNGWPSSGELSTMKINSTLALTSPDLSVNDSKSHSVLSSFASTPTTEESKPVTNPLAPIISLSSAPMPSPEDAEKTWRPTICQLMELTDSAEGEEMTTSFIEPDENGALTPDWESDASDEQSSSSGEFVWKEGDKEELLNGAGSDSTSLLQEPNKMEKIDEEDEDESDSGSDDSCSEGSGSEFVPSTWNSLALPVKSSIKCTNPKSEKKKVMFKKEKYQCIYEYPREPSDDEDSPGPWQSATSPSVFDFSKLMDWELGEVDPSTSQNDGDGSDSEDTKKNKQEFDFYRLDYNMGPHLITDDGEFFINGSTRALDWWEGSNSGPLGTSGPISSEFFPGKDSGDEEILEFTPSASDISTLSLGELRHTKDSLRLELPPVPVQMTRQTDSGIDTSSPPLDEREEDDEKDKK